MSDLFARARAWALLDPDPTTRIKLVSIIDAVERGDAPATELAHLFDGRLRFGTAGIRGPLGPGPRHMNVLLAVQTAAGIARVLLDDIDDVGDAGGAADLGVIIGCDARHRSDAIARAMADTFSAHGIDVQRFDTPVPTPLVAATLLDRGLGPGVVVGIVVTASHNPATDNGIKVFWSDGAQIVTPLDRRIADAIDDVADAMSAAVLSDPLRGRRAAVRIARPGGTGQIRSDLGSSSIGAAADAYVNAALRERSPSHIAPTHLAPTHLETVPLALTSLHGVGADLLERVLKSAGHHDVHMVAEQRDPDPDFPTVAFPNPEEPGALDRLIAVATTNGCVAGLANDPDADRLAVVTPDRNGRWRMLTGDEVGALLCAHLLDCIDELRLRTADAIGTGDPAPSGLLISTTVVSGRLAQAVAQSSGAHVVETLTGFKWLSRPAQQHPDWHQVLAYEEALGYAVGPRARDKDGITAALAMVDLLSTSRRPAGTLSTSSTCWQSATAPM